MKRKLFISVVCILTSLTSFAGDQDTNYVQKFKNIFAVKGFVVNNGFEYTITPRNNPRYTTGQLNDAKVIYTPYIPPTVGVSLNIKGIGISYAFQINNNFWDTTGRVVSDFKQFQMNIYKNTFGFEAYYQDYRRFYFHYNGDQLLYHNYNSDIRAYQWGANGIILFNGRRFSYNAAFNQTEFQKKSAGSFLLMMSLKYSEIKSDNLIPDSVKDHYINFLYLERNRNFAFLLHPGYAYNFTQKNFYVSAAVFAGVGVQLQTYDMQSGAKDVKTGFPLSGRAKGSMGYNGKVLFTGIYANYDITQSVIKPMKTQQMIYSYGFYLGVRAIKYSKTKGQLKAEAKRKRLAEKEAAKKAKEKQKKNADKKK